MGGSATHGLRRLIFVPTYNERDNVTPLLEQIFEQDVDADILFMDDASPDGTGQVLDQLASRHERVQVVHRRGKEGIGTAHKAGIRLAYDRGYHQLITMDSDFAHPPQYIPDLIAAAEGYDIVVGSRYLKRHSLADWNLYRKALTYTGHLLTVTLLKMRYDATGAFRLYRLTSIPRETFDLVESSGYSFFFESLHVLHYNEFAINQIPIHLPGRTFGTSKMRTGDVATSVRFLVSVCTKRFFRSDQLLLSGSRTTTQPPAIASSDAPVQITS